MNDEYRIGCLKAENDFLLESIRRLENTINNFDSNEISKDFLIGFLNTTFETHKTLTETF
jgi:hypothetical protein